MNEVPCVDLGIKQRMMYHCCVDILCQSDRACRICSNRINASAVLNAPLVHAFAQQSERRET